MTCGHSAARLAVVFIAAMLAVSVHGCGPSEEAVKEAGPRNLSSGQVLARVQERYGAVRTVRGEGSITVESKESSHSGSFELNLKKPDSVLVDLHGPFGIHVGTLSLARDRFIFYNRMKNNATIGTPDGETLQGMFHLAMEFDELLNAFTGEFPLAQGDGAPDSFTVTDDGEYRAVFRQQGAAKEYRIDGDNFIITSYRILDGDGKATMVATAARPVGAGAVTMPRLVRVVFPGERRSVTIAYDEITINEAVDCSFRLPESAERDYR